jgi:para-nitrobenzyl esterase
MSSPTRRATLIAAGAAALAGPMPAEAATPVARTRHGQVRGYTERGVHVFKGVRYGADTASYRFRPPQSPQPWTEIAEATGYGHASPQKGREPDQSEDCLFLNVWTPALRDGRRRPVMVYVHGGAHATGSGSSPLYDGVALCRRGDVVVVTVNHRLNVFGYNGLGQILGGPFAQSGSVGNLDLVLALRWVRDNIAEFGGDPDCVTLFGQSGGGAKIVTLMVMPAARGLFHRVITMSGQHVTAMGPQHSELRMRRFLDRLGLSPDRAAELATLPASRLVEALGMPDPLEKGDITFWSVMDHETLPRHPFAPDAPREAAHIPMIIGNTHDEARAFTAGDPRNFTLTWDTVAAKLAPELVLDMNATHVVRRYREIYPQMSPSDVFFAAATAGRSWPGHLVQAQERAKIGAPAWMYQLDFGSPEDPRLKAFHGFDIPLAFDNCDKPGALTGTGPDARAVAAAMSETFIAFARTGDPNNQAIPAWAPYTLDRRPTLIFDLQPRMQDDPRREERLLFSVAPFVKQGT